MGQDDCVEQQVSLSLMGKLKIPSYAKNACNMDIKLKLCYFKTRCHAALPPLLNTLHQIILCALFVIFIHIKYYHNLLQ